MKFFAGLAVSAALVCAASAANAQMAGTMGPVSDVDGPYVGMPPAPVPEPPPPGPRYYDRGYYGPDRGYYGPDRGYYAPDRGYDGQEYRGDYGYAPAPNRGYGPDYGYAPGMLSPNEVYAILRENGFSPLGSPRQRGYTYEIAVLDRGGEDGRLLIDGRNGRIIRFVPASQWGHSYNRKKYEPGPARSRGPVNVPPGTIIRVTPQASVTRPSVASREAPAFAPKPAPLATRPAALPQNLPQKSAANEAHPVQPAPQMSGTVGEAKPAAPPVRPTQGMPKVQGFE